jgi:hypothetical protein
VAQKTESFTYALLSLWPINKQNAPTTEVEKTGLQHIARQLDHPTENYYAGRNTLRLYTMIRHLRGLHSLSQ